MNLLAALALNVHASLLRSASRDVGAGEAHRLKARAQAFEAQARKLSA